MKDTKKYNRSGVVMLIIGIVFLLLLISDAVLYLCTGECSGTVSLIVGAIVGVALTIGGIYFLKHQVKYSWIFYIVTVVIAAAVRLALEAANIFE